MSFSRRARRWIGALTLAVALTASTAGPSLAAPTPASGHSAGVLSAKAKKKTKPKIIKQPRASSAYVGRTASFSVTASGASSYRWQQRKGGHWVWIAKATKKSYAVKATTSLHGRAYRVRVKNSKGSVYSSSAKLTVKGKPTITVKPKATTVMRDKPATFKVSAKGATAYRWQRWKSNRWSDISGATKSSYAVKATSSLHKVAFRVRVSNPSGSVYSPGVRLSVTTPPPALGTRSNPYKLGTTFSSGNWKLKLGKADTDAWSEIRAENPYNDPAPKGHRFVMAPVTAGYHGKNTGLPWLSVQAEFVGKSGRAYDQWTAGAFGCGVLPNDLLDVNDLYPGAKATGNVCAVVPATDISGGVWRVQGEYDNYNNSPWKFVRYN